MLKNFLAYFQFESTELRTLVNDSLRRQRNSKMPLLTRMSEAAIRIFIQVACPGQRA